jgi:hypothetical protein
LHRCIRRSSSSSSSLPSNPKGFPLQNSISCYPVGPLPNALGPTCGSDTGSDNATATMGAGTEPRIGRRAHRHGRLPVERLLLPTVSSDAPVAEPGCNIRALGTRSAILLRRP